MKEDCRDSWGTRLVLDTVADIKFALRQLRKSKGFTVVILSTIALCGGLNVAMYSFLESWILDPFQYPDEDEVMAIGNVYRKQGNRLSTISPLSFVEIERDARSFKAMGLIDGDGGVDVVIEGASPFVTSVDTVTAGIWEAVGVRPLLGQTFSPESVREGHEKVAVLSHAFWSARFDGNSDVLGRKIRLNGQEYSIVGVMPERFRIVSPKPTLWIPRVFSAAELKEGSRDSNSYRAVGRLREGVSMERVRAELDQLFRATFEGHPDRQAAWTRSGLSYGVETLQDFVSKNDRELVFTGTVVLQAMVLGVFAIGCLNIAGLILVKGMSRRKEISMRSSLGATRFRVLRQLLCETLLLFLIGGAISIPVMWIAKDTMYWSLFSVFEFDEATVNVSVLLFAGGTLLGFGLLFGWLPARSILRSSLSGSLSDSSGRSTGGASRSRLQRALMVCQIALACSLLILAVSLVKNGYQVLKKDYGFVAENRVLVKIGTPRYLFEAIRDFAEEVEARIERLPGVLNVATASSVPLSGYNFTSTGFDIVGYPLEVNDAERRTTIFRVGTDYFDTMGIRLIKGRMFDERDREGTEYVVVIDENNAKDYFQDIDPIGSFIRRGDRDCRVVGVVSSTVNAPYYFGWSLDRALYFPQSQWYFMRPASFVVHSSLDLGVLESSIQTLARDINPNLAQIEVIPMQRNIFDSARPELVMAKLTAVFAVLAYALTLIGVYGVISNIVTQRLKEIGIRLALGARSGSIVVQFLKSVSAYTVIGLAVGVVLAYFSLRFLQPFLNGGESIDFLLFASVSLSILACALVAAFVPVFRATSIRPTETLRYE